MAVNQKKNEGMVTGLYLSRVINLVFMFRQMKKNEKALWGVQV